MQGVPDWLQAVGLALAVVATAEVSLFALHRLVRAFTSGPLFHLWAFSAGIFVLFNRLPRRPFDGTEADWSPWAFAASVALLLTVLAAFSLLEQLVLQRPRDAQSDPLLPGLVRDVVRVLLVLLVGILAATMVHRLDLGTVVVSSTVVSAVLGLALQDMLKNVFAGMAMQMEGMPSTGDWVETEGEPARVIEMSWRSTRMRTNEGIDIVEPNASVAQRRLVNYGTGQKAVAFHFEVGLPYGEPPARVKAALLSAGRSTPGVEERPMPLAFTHHYGDSAILYRLRVWTRNVQRIAQFRDAVNSRIWYELHRSKLVVPFPIRTVEFHHSAREGALEDQQRLAGATALLGKVAVFSGLEPEIIEELAQAAVHHHFDDGETLIREGADDDSLMVIEKGKVAVHKEKGSRRVDLAKLEAGDFFGELSLLTDAPRSASITASGPCQVLILRRDALEPILARGPEIVRVLAAALAERAAASKELYDQMSEKTEAISTNTEEGFIRRIQRLFRLPG